MNKLIDWILGILGFVIMGFATGYFIYSLFQIPNLMFPKLCGLLFFIAAWWLAFEVVTTEEGGASDED